MGRNIQQGYCYAASHSPPQLLLTPPLYYGKRTKKRERRSCPESRACPQWWLIPH